MIIRARLALFSMPFVRAPMIVPPLRSENIHFRANQSPIKSQRARSGACARCGRAHVG